MGAPQNSLTNPQSFSTANQQMPSEGPKCIPLGFSFATGATYAVNLTNFMDRGKISIIQGMFVDNSQNANSVLFDFQGTQQNITVKAFSQMYVPVFGLQPVNFNVTSTIGATNVTFIDLYNVPIAPCNWDTTTLANQGTISVSDTILDGTVVSTPYGTGVSVSDKTVFSSAGASQMGLGCVAATSLTVPAGSTRALIQCEGQSVRWRDDGTAPTAAVGQLLATGTILEYNGPLAAIQFIQTAATATLDVSYYK